MENTSTFYRYIHLIRTQDVDLAVGQDDSGLGDILNGVFSPSSLAR